MQCSIGKSEVLSSFEELSVVFDFLVKRRPFSPSKAKSKKDQAKKMSRSIIMNCKERKKVEFQTDCKCNINVKTDSLLCSSSVFSLKQRSGTKFLLLGLG